MRFDHEELEKRLSRHVSEEMLSDFYRGRLDDIDHVTVQCHLIECEGCVHVLRDVTDFLDSADKGHIVMSKEESEQVWKKIREGVKSVELTAILSSRSRSKIMLARWALFTAAAVVMISLVAVGAWVVKLRQDNAKLAQHATALTGELEEAQKELNNRIEEMKKEPSEQTLDQETVRDDKPHETRPAPLSLNVPVYTVYSTESVKRSGSGNEVNRIKLLQRDDSVVLILVGESEQGSPKYGIEIIDPKGRSIRQTGSLRKNSYGNFVISLSREFLRPGTYRIRTRGEAGSLAEKITEYLIRVE